MTTQNGARMEPTSISELNIIEMALENVMYLRTIFDMEDPCTNDTSLHRCIESFNCGEVFVDVTEWQG